MLHKHLAQNRFARAISDHQEPFCRFQDLTVCLYAFVLKNDQNIACILPKVGLVPNLPCLQDATCACSV